MFSNIYVLQASLPLFPALRSNMIGISSGILLSFYLAYLLAF